MLRPSDIEIFQVLEGKDDKAARKVAAWLSSEEGLSWIVENSDRIMKCCEDIHEDADIPSEEMLVGIHRRISQIIRKRKIKRMVTVAACIMIPVAMISAMWININNKLGNVLFSNPEKVCEFAALGERKVVVF